MRVYGRDWNTLTGIPTWKVITTDKNGFNDSVYLTNLAQVCRLNLGESPFWADWGIPAHQSVVTQIPPDFYVALTQKRFSSRFLSLTLQRMPDTLDDEGRPEPYYYVSVVTHYGAYLAYKVPF